MRNCMEWVVCENACNRTGRVVVPLYDTLDANSAEFIMNLTQMSVVFAEMGNLEKVAGLGKKCKTLKTVVVPETPSEEQSKLLKSAGLKVITYEEVVEAGRKNPLSEDELKDLAPKPNDVATICFTSGTTGNPKGVVTTHAAFLGTVGSVDLIDGMTIGTGDVHISYLPLAHIYERAFLVKVFGYH